MPFLSHWYSLVYFLCDIFKNLLDACIEIMKNRSPSPQEIIGRFPFEQAVFFLIKQFQFSDLILYRKPEDLEIIQVSTPPLKLSP